MQQVNDTFSEEEKAVLKSKMESKLKMYDIEGVELVDEDVERVLKEIQNNKTEEEAIDLVLNDIYELLESNKEY